MLKLKLQYFGHSIGGANSLEKTLMLGKSEGRSRGDNREWDSWMASLTRWAWVWATSESWWWTGKPGMLQSMGLQRWTQLNDWTELRNLPGEYGMWGDRESLRLSNWLCNLYSLQKILYTPSLRRVILPWDPNKKITSKYTSPTRRFPSLGYLILNSVKVHQQPSLSQASIGTTCGKICLPRDLYMYPSHFKMHH